MALVPVLDLRIRYIQTYGVHHKAAGYHPDHIGTNNGRCSAGCTAPARYKISGSPPERMLMIFGTVSNLTYLRGVAHPSEVSN